MSTFEDVGRKLDREIVPGLELLGITLQRIGNAAQRAGGSGAGFGLDLLLGEFAELLEPPAAEEPPGAPPSGETKAGETKARETKEG